MKAGARALLAHGPSAAAAFCRPASVWPRRARSMTCSFAAGPVVDPGNNVDPIVAPSRAMPALNAVVRSYGEITRLHHSSPQ